VLKFGNCKKVWAAPSGRPGRAPRPPGRSHHYTPIRTTTQEGGRSRDTASAAAWRRTGARKRRDSASR